MKQLICFVSLLFAMGFYYQGATQVQLGQIDQFEDDTENWQRGDAENGVLVLTADGRGNSGKLVTFNGNQWAGDYISAGITAIEMIVSNPSDVTLDLRLAFGTSNKPSSGGTWFSSTNAIQVAPGTMNESISFPIEEVDLTRVQGNESYNNTFASVQVLRILHNPSPSARGVNVNGSLTIDDITAVGASVETERFVATLTGRNQSNPVPTLAHGQVETTLAGSMLTVSGSFEGLSANLATELAGGAHVHLGMAGRNGGIELILNINVNEDRRSGTFESEENTFELTAAQIEALRARGLYINIHSEAYLSGEIRGQLLPAADAVYGANLMGSYEVPVLMSAAKGAALVEVRGTEMVVTGSFAALEGDFAAQIGGGAHIHIGTAGQNGGVVLPLVTNLSEDLRSGTFDAANNTFSLTVEQLEELADRKYYFNIHTEKQLSGEIRGQIVSNNARAVLRAHLSGANEVPAVTTSAGGMVLTEVMDEKTIQVSGSFNNLEGDLATELAGGAHLHSGIAGRNGGIVVPIVPQTDDQRTGIFPAASNRFEMEGDAIIQLLNREIYVNVHSQASISGELRGQLLPESTINFSGFLSSIFEVPEAASRAMGAVKAELQGNRLVVSGAFSGLSSPVATQILGGAHLHLGYAGQTGGVEFELATDFNEDLTAGTFKASDNTFELSAEQIRQVRGRQFYINIHSQNVPSGELRTQLLFEANSYFVAPLSGASESTPVNTDASGMVIVEVNEGNATATGSFANLTGDLAIDIVGGVHFHEGLAGRNGGIKELLNTTLNQDNKSGVFAAGENTFAVSTGLLDTIRQRMIYVNLHSTVVPSGELRGQLLPLSTTYFTTTLGGINENPPVSTAANGALKLELVGNQLTVTGRFDDLQGTYASQVAGGAHLHLGGVSELGGVEILLNTLVDEDQLGGTYLASDNVFTLTEDQLDALYNAQLYANIHSTSSLPGELRGQILPEINRFPARMSNIVTPSDGADLTIEGEPTTPFIVSWETASDRNPLAYIWQLSADVDFNNIVFQTYTTDTSFTTDYAELDTLLARANIALGASITLYHRAIATDGALQNVGEAASVMLTRGVVEVMEEEEGVDLELSISTPDEAYGIFTKIPYQIIVTNTGTQDATNVRIFAGRPEGIVHTSANITNGIYRLAIERWDIDLLPAGQTDTLNLTLFTLVGGVEVTNFVQVIALDQADIDSEPNNNETMTPAEDDEAAVTIRTISKGERGLLINQVNSTLYPNPTAEQVQLSVETEEAFQTVINTVNQRGQVVMTQEVNLFSGKNTIELEVANLPVGNYFLKIEGTDQVLSFKKVL